MSETAIGIRRTNTWVGTLRSGRQDYRGGRVFAFGRVRFRVGRELKWQITDRFKRRKSRPTIRRIRRRRFFEQGQVKGSTKEKYLLLLCNFWFAWYMRTRDFEKCTFSKLWLLIKVEIQNWEQLYWIIRYNYTQNELLAN